ncbi:MAG: DUF3631 domain-containing protein [Pseudonocardiaceae bacterium]
MPKSGEPLLAIADTAGGHWPDTARGACRYRRRFGSTSTGSASNVTSYMPNRTRRRRLPGGCPGPRGVGLSSAVGCPSRGR